jgi:hypothetical protein
MDHDALRKLPHHQTAAGESTGGWDEMLAAWKLARSALEQAFAASTEGFDPEHMAQLRMQELRAWKSLQNVAALGALGSLSPGTL